MKASAVLIGVGFLLVAYVGGPGEALGQTSTTAFGKKGTGMLGGGLSIDVDWTMESVESDSASVAKSVVDGYLGAAYGYFVLDGLALRVGPVLGYGRDARDESTWLLYGASAGVDYYIPLVGTVFFSLKGAATIELGKIKIFDHTIDARAYAVGLGPGITIAFGGQYGGALSLDLLYEHSDVEYESSDQVFEDVFFPDPVSNGVNLATWYSIFF